MRKAAIIAGLSLSLVSTASADPGVDAHQIARYVAKTYVAPLTRPDDEPARVKIGRCLRVGPWSTCKFRVTGITTCRGLIKVRITGDHFAAWVPELTCSVPK